MGTPYETYDALAVDGQKGVISMNVLISFDFNGLNVDIILTFLDALLVLPTESDTLGLLCYYYDISLATNGVMMEKKPATCTLNKTDK